MNIKILELQLLQVQSEIDKIKSQGGIAPPNTWIEKFVVPKKNGKKYYYYRLMEATNKKSKAGKIQGRLKLYLGKKGSKDYNKYQDMIKRRNILQLLETRLEKILEEYEKEKAKKVSEGKKRKKRIGTVFEKLPQLTKGGVEVLEELILSLFDLIEELEFKIDTIYLKPKAMIVDVPEK